MLTSLLGLDTSETDSKFGGSLLEDAVGIR